MRGKTEAEYDALVTERNRFRAALNEENRHVQSLAALKDSLVSRNRQLRKTLEEIATRIRAQQDEEALSLIADVLGREMNATSDAR
jgi:hypothetical protein